MKKIKIIALCALCLLVGGGLYFNTNQYKEVTLTQAQMEKYDEFKLTITEDTTRTDILSLCTLVEIQADSGWSNYASEGVETHLSEYKERITISGHGDKIYIGYVSKDNQSVALCYTDAGFEQMLINNERKDTSVLITTQEGTLTKNFSKQKIEGLED